MLLLNDVFFEGSAGGGGRFDFGILYYMPQIWTSDNSDAIGRLNIQHGTSFVYPPETMSAHVSECPNHQTFRTTPFKTRGDVAQCFGLGYEFNPSKISSEELVQIQTQIAKHREIEKWFQESDYYRLIDPAKRDNAAWQLVSKNKKKSVAVFVTQLTVAKKIGKHLRLKGLDENKRYHVEPLGLDLSGAFLMNAGIPIKDTPADFESIFFELNEI